MSDEVQRDLDNLWCLPPIMRDIDNINIHTLRTESHLASIKNLLLYNSVLLTFVAVILLGMAIF